MDFNDLPEKNTLTEDEVNNFIIYQTTNEQNIAFKTRLAVFGKFFINTKILDNIKQTVESFKDELDAYIEKLPPKEYVDSRYLLKEQSNFYRGRLLTESRLKEELGNYCTKERVDNDIEICKQHSRSVATSLANNLASIAATAKTSNANTNASIENASTISEAIGEISLEPEEEEPIGD